MDKLGINYCQTHNAIQLIHKNIKMTFERSPPFSEIDNEDPSQNSGAKALWGACLDVLAQELPEQQFNTWIRPLRLEGEEDFAQGLRLLAPNGFILKWVKERYLARIEALGSAFFSSPVSVTLMLGERAKTPNAPSAPIALPVNW